MNRDTVTCSRDDYSYLVHAVKRQAGGNCFITYCGRKACTNFSSWSRSGDLFHGYPGYSCQQCAKNPKAVEGREK